MLKMILKRTACSFLAIVMIVTSVFVFDPSGLFPAADAAITAQTDDMPDVYIVVPETFYMQPSLSESTTVQYYINNTVSGSTITPDEDRTATSGKIWFNVSNGTVTDLTYTIMGTNKLNVPMSAGSGAVTLLGVTLDVGMAAASVRTLEWIFTCKIDGRSAEYHAFSVAYAPYYTPVGAAVNAKHGNAGTQMQGVAWISGVHGFEDSSPTPASGDKDNWIAADYHARTAWDGEWNRPLVPLITGIPNPTNNDENITDWLSQSSTGACEDATFTLYDVDKSVGGWGDKSLDTVTQSHIADITVDISRNHSFTTVPNVTTGFFVSDLKRDSKYMGSYGGYIANYAGDYPGVDFWFSQEHYSSGGGSFAATEGVDTVFFGGNENASNGTRTFTTDAIPFIGSWNRATPTAAGTTTQYIHAAMCCEYSNNWIYINIFLLVHVTAVDKTALRSKVFLKQAQANAKTTDDYAAIREKLEAAYLALGDPTATQAAIDSAAAGLDSIDGSIRNTETVYAQHVNQLTGEVFPDSVTEQLTTRRSDSSVAVTPNSFTGYTYSGMRRTYAAATAFGLFDANAWAQSACRANGSGVSSVDYDAPSRTVTVHNTDAESYTDYPAGNVLSSSYYSMAVDPAETYTIDFDYASATDGQIGVVCYDENGDYIGTAWLSDSFKASGDAAVFRHHTETFCAQSSPYLFGLEKRFDVRYIVLTFGVSASAGQEAADAVFTNVSVVPSDELFDFAQWNTLTSSFRSSTNATGTESRDYDSASKTLTIVSMRSESNTSYTSRNILTDCEVSGTRSYPWHYIPVEGGASYAVEGAYAGTGNGRILIAHYNADGDFTGLSQLDSSSACGGVLADTGDSANFDPFYAAFTAGADDAYISLSFGGGSNPYATAYRMVTNVFRDVKVHAAANADDVYTLYYRPNLYTVSFDANGGVGTMPDQTFAYNVPQNLNANTFTCPGCSFAGWATTANGEKIYNDGASVIDLTAAADATVVLYACWTADPYTMQFDAAGGVISGAYDTEYDVQTTVTLPSAVKDGNTLTGWRADNSGNWGPSTYSAGSPLTGFYGNVTFTAVWKSNTYSVAFNPNGGTGTAMANQSFVYGTPQQLTANAFSRTGYTFGGWALTSNAAEALYQDKESVQDLTTEADVVVTLYAVWNANSYSIVYSTDGGEIRDDAYTTVFTIDDQIVLPASVEKTGYTFGGWQATAKVGSWYLNMLYTGTLNSGMYGNVTLQAQWSLTGYTIQYAADGGTITGSKTTSYDINTAITLPSARKTGYTFGGWQADGTGNWHDTVYQSGTVSAGRYGDVTLTAVWTGVQYFVQFNGNGSTDGIMYNQSFTYGESGTLNRNEYVRNGYSFLGWATSGAAQTAAYEDGGEVLNLTPSANAIVTLYAIWEKVNYTIDYDPNGGEITAAGTTAYTVTDTITLPTAVRKGYALEGWTPQQNSGSWHTWDTYTDTIAYGCYGDVTLVAKWTKDSFTITYDAAGGSISGNYTERYDVDTVIVLPTASRTGYTFGGWQASEAWNGVIVTDTVPADASGNVTLTAVWTANTYYVRFNACGGSGTMEDQTFRFDQAQTLAPNAFERPGYSFSGWAASASGSVVYEDGESVYNLTMTDGAVVNVYAFWSARSFSVVYDLNGAENTLTPSNIVMDGSAITLRAYDDTTETIINDAPYTFAGWSYVRYDVGEGTADYANRSSFALNSEVLTLADVDWEAAKPTITLHAVWQSVAPIRLVAPEGKTTVIDRNRGFIYGLHTGLTRTEFENEWIAVEGNGRIVVSEGSIGTGRTVTLYSNYTNKEVESFTIVIFGDVNGDGNVNSSDITDLRNINAGLYGYWPSADSAEYFAADITHDRNINSSDITAARNANAGVIPISQVLDEN